MGINIFLKHLNEGYLKWKNYGPGYWSTTSVITSVYLVYKKTFNAPIEIAKLFAIPPESNDFTVINSLNSERKVGGHPEMYLHRHARTMGIITIM